MSNEKSRGSGLKKKFVITIISSLLVVIAAATIIFGVLAAQNANVNSGTNIVYNPLKVRANITATYQINSGSTQNLTKNSQATISFNGTEQTNVYSVEFDNPSLQLNSTNTSITFVYTFVNTGTQSFTATVSLPTISNVSWNESSSTTITSHTITVAGGATQTYTIVASSSGATANLTVIPWQLVSIG